MEDPRSNQRQSPVSDRSLESTLDSRSLPEDDGMRQLRQKMHEIRDLASSTSEMASRMHVLMTRDYMTRRKQSISIAQSPLDPAAARETDLLGRYNVTQTDLIPTYAPELEQTTGEEGADTEDGKPVLGCVHYKRNVKEQCFDCNQWHNCRHCHDASPDLPFPHQLNRNMTQNMLCMLCKTPQPAGEVCLKCGEDAAYYYCPKCHLWDNDSNKRIYHCDDCGICRRGEGLGKDYVHCKRCNVCISISTSSTHPCVERATDCDCPLCLEYLFSSSTPVVSLLCGHYMHAACYKDLMHVTYRCPVCNKSAVNMELQWRKLDDEIRLQPMPEEEFEEEEDEDGSSTPALMESTDTRLASGLRNILLSSSPPRGSRRIPKRVWIGCNDCGGRGWTNFHWLGLKCPVCDGYNTNQMMPIGDRSRAPMPGTQRQRQHDFTGLHAVRAFGLEPEPDDRADSAYGIATSPASQPRQVPEIATPQRSYFLLAEDEGLLRRPDSAPVEREPYRLGGISPYDLLQNVGRSLSPMRMYLEEFDSNVRDRAAYASRRMSEYAASMAPKRFNTEQQPRRPHSIAEGETENVGFWGADGAQFLSGGEEGDDEDEEDGSGSEEDEDDDDDLDGLSIEGDGDGENEEDDMELFGHR